MKVVDETGKLEYGQVFFQYSEFNKVCETYKEEEEEGKGKGKEKGKGKGKEGQDTAAENDIQIKRKTRILTGRVALSKSPAHHPGGTQNEGTTTNNKQQQHQHQQQQQQPEEILC